MEYARLGADGPLVSRVGFGCEPLGGTDWGAVDARQAEAAVRRALELGVTLFDTADAYGLGRSEEALSAALAERRHDAVIVSKFGIAWEHAGDGRARTWKDASPARVTAALEASLRRLRVDRIPVYLVHWPDGATPVEATMEALARQVEGGKVGWVGLSNFAAPEVRRAHAAFPLAAVECEYGLLAREAEAELLPACAELGVGVLAYGALAQGLLTGKYRADARFGADDRRHRLPRFQGEALSRGLETADRLAEAGAAVGATPAQLALRWALEGPAVAAVIAGAKTPAQAEANAAAAGLALPPGLERPPELVPSAAPPPRAP
ncbi:MAG: aldo/keto reductase [Gemmatimonadetes bacterium]|nr:aldo/keto reductase [Gemmatimonadota bacterium]